MTKHVSHSENIELPLGVVVVSTLLLVVLVVALVVVVDPLIAPFCSAVYQQ